MPKTTTTARCRVPVPSRSTPVAAAHLKCRCKHCHHTWRTIRPRLPKVCPACKSHNWQRPPQKPGGRRRATKVAARLACAA